MLTTSLLSATTLQPETFDKALATQTMMLEKPVRTAALYPFPVSRRASDKETSRGRWANTSVEPGFGDLDCIKPVAIYGRNGTGWEEPSVGYVKVHIRF